VVELRYKKMTSGYLKISLAGVAKVIPVRLQSPPITATKRAMNSLLSPLTDKETHHDKYSA
jgi:hypothetical protein